MRKFLLLVAAGLATLSIGAAGAYFTGQAQVPENVIKAGSVAISTEPTSAALSIESLAPGTTATRSLSVLNDGDLPVTVVVTCAKKAGITDFYDALTCRVTAGGTALYEGPLSAMRTNALTLQAAARSEMQFAVGLPDTAGNDLAGDYAKLTLYVDAEQVH
jgi:hypothetical protein